MTHGEIAARRHPETLPDWITWPAITLIAASFGIRWAAMVQHEFGVVFTTLVFDAAWLLPLWIVSTVPIERFRKLRVPRPPLPQLVLKISLRLAVAAKPPGAQILDPTVREARRRSHTTAKASPQSATPTSVPACGRPSLTVGSRNESSVPPWLNRCPLTP